MSDEVFITKKELVEILNNQLKPLQALFKQQNLIISHAIMIEVIRRIFEENNICSKDKFVEMAREITAEVKTQSDKLRAENPQQSNLFK